MKSAVLSDFAMNGDSLNFSQSNESGMKVATLLLAICNSSTTVLRPACCVRKHLPGVRSGVPKTTSAVEVAESVFGAFLNPRSTHGRDLDHDLLALTAHRKAFFSVEDTPSVSFEYQNPRLPLQRVAHDRLIYARELNCLQV